MLFSMCCIVYIGSQSTLVFTLDYSAEVSATRGDYDGYLLISHDYGGSGTIVQLDLSFSLTSPGFVLDITDVSRTLRYDTVDSTTKTITVTNDGRLTP